MIEQFSERGVVCCIQSVGDYEQIVFTFGEQLVDRVRQLIRVGFTSAVFFSSIPSERSVVFISVKDDLRASASAVLF